MSFGRQQPNNQPLPQPTPITSSIPQPDPNSKHSPQSNSTPCFHSVTPSSSPQKLPIFKSSWQETPPDEKIHTGTSQLNDSFCEFQKKLDVLEKQRRHLYEETKRACVLVPVKIEEGNVVFITDRFDCLTLPRGLGEFRNGEAVIMAVEHQASKFYQAAGLQPELLREFQEEEESRQ